MRVSTPGKRVERRNLKSDSQVQISMDKIQPAIPSCDPDYDMQYGCSRKTGRRFGGYFYNPPNFCEKKIMVCDDERWILVHFCKGCSRYLSKTCPARSVDTDIYDTGYIEDSPQARKARRLAQNGNGRPRRVS